MIQVLQTIAMLCAIHGTDKNAWVEQRQCQSNMANCYKRRLDLTSCVIDKRADKKDRIIAKLREQRNEAMNWDWKSAPTSEMEAMRDIYDRELERVK